MANIQQANKLRADARSLGIRVSVRDSLQSIRDRIAQRLQAPTYNAARNFFKPQIIPTDPNDMAPPFPVVGSHHLNLTTMGNVTRLDINLFAGDGQNNHRSWSRALRRLQLTGNNRYTIMSIDDDSETILGNTKDDKVRFISNTVFKYKSQYGRYAIIFFYKTNNDANVYSNLFTAAVGNCIINPIKKDILADKNTKNNYLKTWILDLEKRIGNYGFDPYKHSQELASKGFGIFIKDVVGNDIVAIEPNKRRAYYYIANADHGVNIDKTEFMSCFYCRPDRIQIVSSEDDILNELFEKYERKTILDIDGVYAESTMMVTRPKKDFTFLEPIYRCISNIKIMVGARTPQVEYHICNLDQKCCDNLNVVLDTPGIFTTFDMRVNRIFEKYNLWEKCPDANLYNYLKDADFHMGPINYPGAKSGDAFFIDICSAFPSYSKNIFYDHYRLPYMPSFFMSVSLEQSNKYKMSILKRTGFSSVTNMRFSNSNISMHAKVLGLDNRNVFPNPLLAYLYLCGEVDFDITSTAYNNSSRDIDFEFGNCKFENCAIIGKLLSGARPIKTRAISTEHSEYYKARLIANGKFAGLEPAGNGVEYIKFYTDERQISCYHVHSYILAYQLISMLEILKNIEPQNCIRFNVDCIYTKVMPQLPDYAISVKDYRESLKTKSVTDFFGMVKYGQEKVNVNSRHQFLTEKRDPSFDIDAIPQMDDEIFENIDSQIVCIEAMAGAGKSEKLLKLLKLCIAPSVSCPTNCLAWGLTNRGIKAQTTCRTFGINPFIGGDIKLGNNGQVTDWMGKHVFVMDDAGLDNVKIIELVTNRLISMGKQICLTFDPKQCRFRADDDQRILEDLPVYKKCRKWGLNRQYRMDDKLTEIAKKYGAYTTTEMWANMLKDFKTIKLYDLHKEYTDLKNDIIISPMHHTRDFINKYIFNSTDFNFIQGDEWVKIREEKTVEGKSVKGRIRLVTRDMTVRKAGVEMEIDEAIIWGDKLSSITPMHAICVQSLQGATIEGKVFIDARNVKKIWDSSIFYTSITRARKWDNIFLIT